MNFKEFIKTRLQKLANLFPELQIRYAFDTIADIHVVELTPRDLYDNNAELDAEWMKISLDALTEYPNELISFVTDDCTVKIENAELTFNERIGL